MTSANENIFHVTGHLCGEFTGLRWIPHTKASDAELWCFLSKQSWGCWFETPSHPLWRHCNEFACEALSGMMRTTTRGRIVNRFEMTYDRQTCETVKSHMTRLADFDCYKDSQHVLHNSRLRFCHGISTLGTVNLHKNTCDDDQDNIPQPTIIIKMYPLSLLFQIKVPTISLGNSFMYNIRVQYSVRLQNASPVAIWYQALSRPSYNNCPVAAI